MLEVLQNLELFTAILDACTILMRPSFYDMSAEDSENDVPDPLAGNAVTSLQTIRAACAQVTSVMASLASQSQRVLESFVPFVPSTGVSSGFTCVTSATIARSTIGAVPLQEFDFNAADAIISNIWATFKGFAIAALPIACADQRRSQHEASIQATVPNPAQPRPNTYTLAVTSWATDCFYCGRGLPRGARCFSRDGARFVICFQCHAGSAA